MRKTYQKQPYLSRTRRRHIRRPPRASDRDLQRRRKGQLPPRPPRLHRSHLSLRQQRRQNTLRSAQTRTRFRRPSLHQNSRRSNGLQFPNSLQRPHHRTTRHTKRRKRRAKQRTNTPLPPKGNLAPFPNTRYNGNEGFQYNIPTFTTFPSTRPHTFVLSFSPIYTLNAYPHDSPPTCTTNPANNETSYPTTVYAKSTITYNDPTAFST